MDTIKYTEIKEESSRVEIHGDNVEVIDIAQAELRKVEIVAAAQAKAIAMKEEAPAAEEPAAAEESAEAPEESAAAEESAEAPEEPAEVPEETAEDPEKPAADSDEKVHVIGVRFRTAGKVYFFDPGEWEVRHGCHVIVETARGIEYGTVVGLPMDVKASKVTQPLKEVIRVATFEDNEIERNNRAKEKEAYRICQEKIYAHGLDMKLINAEYTFDRRDQDPGRLRHLRQTSVLPHLDERLHPGLHQDGKRAKPLAQSRQDFGCVRPSDVLPQE